MKKTFSVLSVLLLLLFFHDASLIGVQNGLLLWYQVLIPSLLPFIIVTNALSEIHAYEDLFCLLFPIFKNRTYEIIVLFLGNLCGYPIGGTIMNHLMQNQLISKNRADLLLPLSSQASPMFIIGYIYTHILNKSIPFGIFALCIYGPVVIGYIFLSLKTTDNDYRKLTKQPVSKHVLPITDTFFHAVKTMTLIGIYVILFSILYSIFLSVCHWTLLKLPLSLLEITTGLQLLKTTFANHAFFLPIIGFLTVFGGLCSVFQIQCVCPVATKKYLSIKLLLSTGTFLLLSFYNFFY